jgi:hypothetical protein
MAAAKPDTWAALMWMPLFGSDSLGAILPTIVTSSPSRIHTVPSPMITTQCHLAQGSPSSRAGILVWTVQGIRGSSRRTEPSRMAQRLCTGRRRLPHPPCWVRRRCNEIRSQPFVIALGAVLTFGVTHNPSGWNVHAVGVILMLVVLAGLAIGYKLATVRRRTDLIHRDDRETLIEPHYPPPEDPIDPMT